MDMWQVWRKDTNNRKIKKGISLTPRKDFHSPAGSLSWLIGFLGKVIKSSSKSFRFIVFRIIFSLSLFRIFSSLFFACRKFKMTIKPARWFLSHSLHCSENRSLVLMTAIPLAILQRWCAVYIHYSIKNTECTLSSAIYLFIGWFLREICSHSEYWKWFMIGAAIFVNENKNTIVVVVLWDRFFLRVLRTAFGLWTDFNFIQLMK